MHLYDEIYFEITATGAKSDLNKLEKFLTSGELDDFFEVCRDYISYDDAYQDGNDEECEMVFTNDELGIEVDSFDVDEFLDVFTKAAKPLYVRGSFYDNDDNEFSFTSPKGSSEYYDDANTPVTFNDELDEAAREEEEDEEE